jgi:hypothetical protein
MYEVNVMDLLFIGLIGASVGAIVMYLLLWKHIHAGININRIRRISTFEDALNFLLLESEPMGPMWSTALHKAHQLAKTDEQVETLRLIVEKSSKHRRAHLYLVRGWRN